MSPLPLVQIIFYKCKLRIIFPNKSGQIEIPSSPFLREWHRLVLKDYLCVEQMDRGKSAFLSPCPFLLYITRAKWDVFHFKNLIKQTEQKPILLVFTVSSILGLNQGILGLEGEWSQGLTARQWSHLEICNFWKVRDRACSTPSPWGSRIQTAVVGMSERSQVPHKPPYHSKYIASGAEVWGSVVTDQVWWQDKE